MKLRRAVIAFSAVALTLNLTVAVHAAGPTLFVSGHHSNQKLSYVGFRSHGFPISPLSYKDTFGTSKGSGQGGSFKPYSQNDDQNWLRSFFSNFNFNSGSNLRALVNGANATVGQPAANPISYHGGATLTGTISVIPVWVGGWASSDVITWNSFLGNIFTSLGTAPANPLSLPNHVFNTNTLYYASQGLTVPSLEWVSNLSITAPSATNVSDSDVVTDINSFISANPNIVPDGTTPLYVYIGAKNTLLTSGFGSTYCGWHTYGLTDALTNVPFIALQDFQGAANNKACASQQPNTVNGNIGLDSVANILVHETDESLTDPFFNAWYDASGEESADKCVWTWGKLKKAGTGSAQYDVTLGSVNYLIQQDWLENNLVTPTGAVNGIACSIAG
ncbi:MAG: hypothetical protein WDN07_00480 [Actinomycetota bacterium]